MAIRTHYSHEVVPKLDGKTVRVAGWISEIRLFGGINFIILRDREGTVQVTVKKKDNPELVKELANLGKEYVIVVYGKVKHNPEAPRKVEIIADKITVLNSSHVPLPLDISGKIESDLDTRLNARFMDVRRPDVASIFLVKDAVTTAIREYLESHGFIEIHTPKVVAAGAEGGATLFPIDYFGTKAYLSQSPQLFKQKMMASGLDMVYEIAPYFRAEKSDTSRHVSEFTMWDVEMAFIESQEDVLRLLEGTMEHVFKHVIKHCAPQLDLLKAELSVPKAPFPRISYAEACKMLKIKPHGDLDTGQERKLGEKMMKKGYDMFYVVDYPEKAKPFYIMEKGAASHSFDLNYRGVEMASGGQREHRYAELMQRMKKQSLNPKDFEFYLKAFRYGMPPHGGFGFGVERLMQKMLGLKNIREAVLFPRDRKRLVP